MEISLKGKMLIAMPGLDDPNFDQSVILICEHSPEGAMGFVINKRSADISLNALFDQLAIPLSDDVKRDNKRKPVRSGGPCHPSNGFVVFPHAELKETTDPRKVETVDNKHCFSSDLNMLRDIAGGTGPQKFSFVLGFAGWDAGQLESELMENAWLHVDADEDLLYTNDLRSVWKRAISALGIEPAQLSSMAGSA